MNRYSNVMAKQIDSKLYQELENAFDRNQHGRMYQLLSQGADPNFNITGQSGTIFNWEVSTLLKTAIGLYDRPRTKLLLHFGAKEENYVRCAIQEAIIQEKKDILREIQYFDEFFPEQLEDVMLYPIAILAELLYRGRDCPKMQKIAKKYVRSGLSYKHHTNHFVDSQAHMMYLGFHAQAVQDFKKGLCFFPEDLQEMILDYVFKTPKHHY